MASSVSGADDYASVMYYSHTQYNDSNVAITSSKTELLSTQMMENQSNYTVGIDKLKISSLDGVILSYFPQNKLKLGLQLTNTNNITKYVDTTVLKEGFVDTFVQQLEHYYCSYTNNSNIVNVFNQSGSFKITITLPRLPNKVFYNNINNFLYYHDNIVLYSYNITDSIEYKEDEITFLTTGIYNMDYNEISQQLVITSGKLVFSQYDVIQATGSLLLINSFSFSYLENITAVQCGTNYIYIISNIDVNYISATQTLYIYEFTGSLLSFHLDVSSNNMIRQIECKYEDNLYNFFCEGTIASYNVSNSGGAYIPCIIGRITDGGQGVDRLLTNYTQEVQRINPIYDQIGNYVFNNNNNKVYISIISGTGLSFVIETYNNITAPQSFQLQQGQPSASPLPTNIISNVTYFARLITYMNFDNVNYLLSSVIESNSQIQIYILKPDDIQPPSTNYTFYEADYGQSPLNISTLLAPLSGSVVCLSSTDSFSDNIVPGFLDGHLTSNLAFGTAIHYYYVANPYSVYVFEYGNTTAPIIYDMTTLLNQTSNIVAMVVKEGKCYVVLDQPSSTRYIITNINDLENGVVLTGIPYDSSVIFTSISINLNDIISINARSTSDSYTNLYDINNGFYEIFNNVIQPSSNSYSILSPSDSQLFYAIDTKPNKFVLNNYTTNTLIRSYLLRTLAENVVSFLGYDLSGNVLVLSKSSTDNTYTVNAFSTTSTLLVYHFGGYVNPPVAISQYVEVSVPQQDPEWQLYQTIVPRYFPIDMGNNNFEYPQNDIQTHITVDEHYNLILTYCNQEGDTSNQGVYCSVLLTPPASSNNTIVINTQPYVPINIILSYKNFNLGSPSDGILQNTNLMYDNLMKCYYARYNNILLKGNLDLINNRINFIDYFNFNLLNPYMFINQYGKFMYCVENSQYKNQINQYSPSILSLYNNQSPNVVVEFLNQTLQKYIEPVITYNILEKYYIFSSDVPYMINYYTNNQSLLQYITTQQITQFSKISNTFAYTIAPPIPLSVLAVYSLQEYIDSINNAFNTLLILINSNGFLTNIKAPSVSMNYQTGYLTLNYDPSTADFNNGIFVNDALLSYMKFQVSPSSTPFLSNKYKLNSSGTNTQTKVSFLKFNTIDKIIVNSNMSIIGDQVGGNTTSITFSDLDLNMNDPIFLNMSGNFIYDPSLIRVYTLISNQGLRSINYSVVIRYLDKSELPFLIQPGENVSIKFIFNRIY